MLRVHVQCDYLHRVRQSSNGLHRSVKAQAAWRSGRRSQDRRAEELQFPISWTGKPADEEGRVEEVGTAAARETPKEEVAFVDGTHPPKVNKLDYAKVLSTLDRSYVLGSTTLGYHHTSK